MALYLAERAHIKFFINFREIEQTQEAMFLFLILD